MISTGRDERMKHLSLCRTIVRASTTNSSVMQSSHDRRAKRECMQTRRRRSRKLCRAGREVHVFNENTPVDCYLLLIGDAMLERRRRWSLREATDPPGFWLFLLRSVVAKEGLATMLRCKRVASYRCHRGPSLVRT